jgi:hypothetical protein
MAVGVLSEGAGGSLDGNGVGVTISVVGGKRVGAEDIEGSAVGLADMVGEAGEEVVGEAVRAVVGEAVSVRTQKSVALPSFSPPMHPGTASFLSRWKQTSPSPHSPSSSQSPSHSPIR